MAGMKLRAATLLLAVLAGGLTACRENAQQTVPVGSSRHTLSVDGRTREYRVFRPDSLPAKASLVVMLHGGFGSAEQAEKAYGWDELAQREHVVIAYPDGLDRAWAVGGGCCGAPGRTGVDDVAFISAVVAQIGQLLPLDPAHVYATGMSNGAMMSYRLACDTKLFAAVAPVAGTVLGACDSPAPISVLHIHGLADRNVPFDGSQGEGVARIDGPPVPEIIARVRALDNCQTPTESTADRVTTSIANCPNGRAVELITIQDAGHEWPGSARTQSAPLDATEVIWRFFAAHPGS
jgi:polyhydroxybutyrate depolymerase